jgi:PAS domain S-box-containing protein
LLHVTLSSIGDAVITTDTQGRVTFMNPVTESVTGWNQADALGKPLDEVFRIINVNTLTTVESPVARVIREGTIVGLANHTVLIARNGTEVPIDDSAAPIRNNGDLIGVVLVFRDVTERNRAEAERAELLDREQLAGAK